MMPKRQRSTFALAASLIFMISPGAFGIGASGTEAFGEERANQHDATSSDAPVVVGHGVGLFKIGTLVAHDDFDNLDNWVIQVQKKSGFAPAKVEARNGTLDCLLPGRGCTIWFKKKLKTRVAITYDVLCPTPNPETKGVRPRDINNFWMCSDPDVPDDFSSASGLFDGQRYTGAFKSYDKMHGYYASTGGGPADRPTTRMRRYPREVNGKPTEHIALTDKDGRSGYLLTPDKSTKIQLVAFDDVVQYIVDGKLVYQFALGDSVQMEPETRGQSSVPTTYQADRFPIYREGYFGFRMVGSHHIYSNFKVHALVKDSDGKRRPTVRVDSLDGLREVISKSDQQIKLMPGRYKVADRNGFHFAGSNNDIDLTDVHIEVPLDVASGRNLFRLAGNHITLRGGTIEDTYPEGRTKVTDYGRYNRSRKYGRMNEIVIPGDDNRVIGTKLIVRGSFPYGYGNMFGIGAGAVVGLSKHCGIQITGNRCVIDGCHLKMEAFGHAIFVQGGDRTTVRNTVVEGTLRPSNDCYEETHDGDLAKRFHYKLQWPDLVRGLPIPRDHMINCTEDGIRAYKGAGEMVVENCIVKKCRGGIKLYMAKSANVTDCEVLDCVVQGYSLPSRGVIRNSSGNAAYGPLLYVHSDRHTGQQIELTVHPSPHSLGDHPLAAIKGRGHTIEFARSDQTESETPRPIIVGYPMRFDFLCTAYPDVPKGLEQHFKKHSPGTYVASDITLVNETTHPVVLGELSEKNIVNSAGEVRDLGSSNAHHQSR